jgi:hypothetical protein
LPSPPVDVAARPVTFDTKVPEAKPVILQPAETKIAAAAITPTPPPATEPTKTEPSPQGPLPDGRIVGEQVVTVTPSEVTSSPAVVQPVVTQPAVAVERQASASVENAPKPFDLAAIVESIEIPKSEQERAVAPVDLTKIKPAQTKADAVAETKDPKTGKSKAEPKTPPQPARIWVQVATGAEAALGGDYRRFAKKSPELFKGKEGWTSVWGKSSRLLVGPFADAKTAKKWEADYRKAGGNGFVWNSENGTIVKKLGAK